jgi:hypothetical protein
MWRSLLAWQAVAVSCDGEGTYNHIAMGKALPRLCCVSLDNYHSLPRGRRIDGNKNRGLMRRSGDGSNDSNDSNAIHYRTY